MTFDLDSIGCHLLSPQDVTRKICHTQALIGLPVNTLLGLPAITIATELDSLTTP